MSQGYEIKDYQSVREELRHFSRNQLTIISILVTASVTGYAYSLEHIDKLIVVTGFVIPVLFAVLGTLWIDQVYRQRELALYSYLLENEMFGNSNTKGWEHYVQEKRARKKAHSFNGVSIPVGIIRYLINSASLYYYGLFSLGLVVVPALSSKYSFLQVSKIEHYASSQIYTLGPKIIIIQFLLEVLYIINIFALQKELNEAVKKNLRRSREHSGTRTK